MRKLEIFILLILGLGVVACGSDPGNECYGDEYVVRAELKLGGAVYYYDLNDSCCGQDPFVISYSERRGLYQSLYNVELNLKGQEDFIFINGCKALMKETRYTLSVEGRVFFLEVNGTLVCKQDRGLFTYVSWGLF